MSSTIICPFFPLRSSSPLYSSQEYPKNNNAIVADEQTSQLALILLIVGIFVPCLWIVNWAIHKNSSDPKARQYAEISGILQLIEIVVCVVVVVLVAVGSVSRSLGRIELQLCRDQSSVSMQPRSSRIYFWLFYRKKQYWIFLSFLTILIAVGLFNYTDFFSKIESPMTFFSFQTFNSVIARIIQSDTTTTSTTTTTDSTTTTTTATTTPFEIVVNMDDRTPSYKLATRNGSKPYTSGARAKLLDILHLHDKCQQNSSTIVVDVGANLGDFGLYAAACGCTVHMFEIQAVLVALIRISIRINTFSASSVYLYHNTVSDLPSNSTLELVSPLETTTSADAPAEIQTIRLDDIPWSSSIFLLKIELDDAEVDVLRSAEKLFYEKRIQHLILYYDTVVNDETTKLELIDHIQQVLKPEYVYVFHPNEKQLYGPLSKYDLKTLPSQQDKQRPLIGLYAVFDQTIKKKSIGGETYDPLKFFA